MTFDVERYRATANTLVRNPDDPIALVDMFALAPEKSDHTHHYWLARRAWCAEKTINTVFNYGSACQRTGRFRGARDLYREALKIAPDDAWRAKCLHHIGMAFRALGQNELAIDYYSQAITAGCEHSAYRDRALAVLASGDLQRGFELLEVRKHLAEAKLEKNGKLISQARLPDNVIHWQGDDLNGKTITVYHEEGCGDFIQLCRYIPALRHLGAEKIFLTGQVPSVLDLVANNLAIDGIFPLAGPIPTDYVVGSLSLPWRVGISYKTVSGRPYFRAAPAKLPKRGAVNVGLVWRGNSDYGNDLHRSMAFSEFCPLFDLPGVAFHSLQCGPAGLEVDDLGLSGFVANLEPFLYSWLQTASVIRALDLVVSVDTACAHLAGALGVPVLTLTTAACDWRWPRVGEKTPWYDSMRVIRQQKQGDWPPSILRAKEIIKEMSVERRRRSAA